MRKQNQKNIKNSFVILILVLFIVLGCENKTYTAQWELSSLSNQIPKAKLDSIINRQPYWQLDEYKTTNINRSDAVKLLRSELRNKGYKLDEYFIYEIIDGESFTYGERKFKEHSIVFYLNHVDVFVYQFNKERKNEIMRQDTAKDGSYEEYLGISGNITRVDGWYVVDLQEEKVEILLGQ